MACVVAQPQDRVTFVKRMHEHPQGPNEPGFITAVSQRDSPDAWLRADLFCPLPVLAATLRPLFCPLPVLAATLRPLFCPLPVLAATLLRRGPRRRPKPRRGRRVARSARRWQQAAMQQPQRAPRRSASASMLVCVCV